MGRADGKTGFPLSAAVGGKEILVESALEIPRAVAEIAGGDSSLALTCCSMLAAAWKEVGLRKLEAMPMICAL